MSVGVAWLVFGTWMGILIGRTVQLRDRQVPWPRPPDETVMGLRPDLRDTLASLHGTPRPIAETVMQLIAYEDRPALEAAGIITPGPVIAGEYRALRLTDYGLAVIAAAHAAREEAS